MAKKNFDTFLETVKTPKSSLADIEEMTREVHSLTQKKEEKTTEPVREKPPKLVQKSPKKLAKPAKKEVVEPVRRGRKPNPPEEERLIRVSVDLPESTIIELKGIVTRERTDMKNFIRQLVEERLGK